MFYVYMHCTPCAFILYVLALCARCTRSLYSLARYAHSTCSLYALALHTHSIYALLLLLYVCLFILESRVTHLRATHVHHAYYAFILGMHTMHIIHAQCPRHIAIIVVTPIILCMPSILCTNNVHPVHAHHAYLYIGMYLCMYACMHTCTCTQARIRHTSNTQAHLHKHIKRTHTGTIYCR